MKYKALICDYDGTLVPYGKSHTPSASVIAALKKASERVYVGIATGRPLFSLNHAFDYLTLSSPCIINGGAQIYDPITKKILEEYPLENHDLLVLCEKILKMNLKLVVNDGEKDYQIKKLQDLPERVMGGIIYGLTDLEAEQILKLNNDVPTFILHKLPDWKKNLFEININHVFATKQHGISTIAKLLNINTHEIISIGDSYNDFPLLMASGLKVAMGNAFEDLKEIADYVAPSVADDGVADVVKKFIIDY